MVPSLLSDPRMTHQHRIIWSVDPLENSLDALQASAAALRALKGGRCTLRVFPIYVWGASTPEAIPNPAQWNFIGIRTHAQRRLNALMKKSLMGQIHVAALEVPRTPSTGVSDGVTSVLEFAKRKRADLIVVATHGRRGPKRWVLGSFTETLLLASRVPVISVHPHWKKNLDFKTILFATDFSARSRSAFRQVIEFARAHSSRVVLFHRVAAPFLAAVQPAFTAYDVYREAMLSEMRRCQELSDEWIRMGRLKGVEVEARIDDFRSRSVSHAVIQLAEKLGAVVALASQSGPVASALMGSHARKIVRNCRQPVWIVR